MRLGLTFTSRCALLSALLLALAGGAALWPSPPDVSDLPLVELPVQSDSPEVVVLLSGDGGWTGLVRDVSAALNASGLSVVGLDCFRYFWKRKTPEQTAADMERLLDHYLSLWGKTGVVLAGYSRGADVLPATVVRLPEERRNQIRLIALIGAATSVQFVPTALGILNLRVPGPAIRLMPDLEKLRGTRILCFYGSEERDTICSSMDPQLAECVKFEGGHHFRGDSQAIGRRIAAELTDRSP